MAIPSSNPQGIPLLCKNLPFPALSLSLSLATKTWNPPSCEIPNSLSLNSILYLALRAPALRASHKIIRSRTPGAPTSCPLVSPLRCTSSHCLPSSKAAPDSGDKRGGGIGRVHLLSLLSIQHPSPRSLDGKMGHKRIKQI